MDEVREARNWTPMSLQTMSLHLPLHFKDARLITLGGLNDKHYNTTLESMIEQGALGIGEAGPLGIGKKGEELDINYVDFLYLPFLAREKTRVQLSRQEAMALKAVLFAVPLDRKALSELVKQLNIKSALDSLISLVEHYGEHQQLAIDKCIEAAQAAKELDVPLCLHNSPDTRPLVLEVAERLNQRLIAAHCNFGYKPQEACEVARAIKKSGGWVDILGGDYFGIRSYFPNHATTFALVAEGLVDLISTDYIGGYWDSILQVLRYFVEQNMLNLPDAISLATGNVCKAIPHIAPDRGLISEGKIADLAILSPDDIAKVTTVIIGGRVVVNEGRMVAPSEGEEC
jgi:imidazolonepropionase-like amidohydrolase